MFADKSIFTWFLFYIEQTDLVLFYKWFDYEFSATKICDIFSLFSLSHS